jgi:hypothetical protein
MYSAEMSTDILKYCFCVINKKNGEITYYPKFQIKEHKIPVAPSTDFTITISDGTDEATLICTEKNNLLNKSPYEMFELDDLPTAIKNITDELKNISKFVKSVNDGFTPFCAPIQLWMNPESILTKDYLPKELILMEGITEEPKPIQKGELMCKMLLDNSFEGCKLKVEDNFNSIDTDVTKLKKGKEPDEPVKAAATVTSSGPGSTATVTSTVTSSGPGSTATATSTASTATGPPAKPKRSEKPVVVAVSSGEETKLPASEKPVIVAVSSGEESAKSVVVAVSSGEETKLPASEKPIVVAVSSGEETKPAEPVVVAVSSGEETKPVVVAVTPPVKPKRNIIKGAGLKSCKATDTFEGCLKRNFAMPRIYRPVQQRKTDYYNYA